MEKASSRGREASAQRGLGVDFRRCSSSKELRGPGVCAKARHMVISLSFPVAGVSLFLSPILRRVEVQWRATVRERQYRDMNPTYVGAVHYCKAPSVG